MRKELNQMETIENYIKGNLSPKEKAEFEQQLATNPELQKEVQLQQELMDGIERTGLKQSIKQAFKKYTLKKNLKNWGLGGLGMGVIIAIAYVGVKFIAPGEGSAQLLPQLNEQGEELWADADKYLPLQMFELNAEKDTVIETEDGIVLAIPANCFLDENGQPVKGDIELEVKEALNAADIIKAGLSTKSGDNLLETGGMFYINARQNGKSLQINKNNGIYAQIPTDEVKRDMQLFEGKRISDGSIDWVNPKKLENFLVPVDIFSLNFYPPNYLDSLKGWGYNIKDKKFTDSLYYSFASMFCGNINEMPVKNIDGKTLFKQNCAACHRVDEKKLTGPGLTGVSGRVPQPAEEWLLKYIKNNVMVHNSGDTYAKKLMDEYKGAQMTIFTHLSDAEIRAIIEYINSPNDYKNSISIQEYNCDIDFHGINPAFIKTIWSEPFQNTLIATKEFEERMPYIHQTCYNQILSLYVNNLGKNMCTIDSMVAFSEAGAKQRDKFLEFAARGDGKVKIDEKQIQLLKNYYQKQSKIYAEAIRKTTNEFWQKHNKKDIEAAAKRQEHTNDEITREDKLFREELNLNLDEAYRQLGQKRAIIPQQQYSATITTTGWKNVDRFVFESTTNRTTLDYTDPNTGKKAVIKYEPLSVSVENSETYDRVLVYLIPDKLNSFMKMKKNSDNKYEENLNELMTHQLVSIAYKGEETFYYENKKVGKGEIAISLNPSSDAEIQKQLNKLSGENQKKEMKKELDFLQFEKEENKRQQMLNSKRELNNKIQPVIFPCMSFRQYPSEVEGQLSSKTDSTRVIFAPGH